MAFLRVANQADGPDLRRQLWWIHLTLVICHVLIFVAAMFAAWDSASKTEGLTQFLVFAMVPLYAAIVLILVLGSYVLSAMTALLLCRKGHSTWLALVLSVLIGPLVVVLLLCVLGVVLQLAR